MISSLHFLLQHFFYHLFNPMSFTNRVLLVFLFIVVLSSGLHNKAITRDFDKRFIVFYFLKETMVIKTKTIREESVISLLEGFRVGQCVWLAYRKSHRRCSNIPNLRSLPIYFSIYSQRVKRDWTGTSLS